jgi:CRP/FNR family nitrogen fixation transcriptional regulator
MRARIRQVLTLPISRYDIAEYLTVAVETVSRVLAEARDRGIITAGGDRRLQVCTAPPLEKYLRYSWSRSTLR